MTDENPYRFTGGTPTPAALASDRLRLSEKALRSLARGRWLTSALTLLYDAALVGTYLVAQVNVSLRIHLQDVPLVTAVLAVTVLGFLLLLDGVRLIEFASPRLGYLKAIALLVPIVNLFVVAFVVVAAHRTLARRGVKVGLVRCDFSGVDAEVSR